MWSGDAYVSRDRAKWSTMCHNHQLTSSFVLDLMCDGGMPMFPGTEQSGRSCVIIINWQVHLCWIWCVMGGMPMFPGTEQAGGSPATQLQHQRLVQRWCTLSPTSQACGCRGGRWTWYVDHHSRKYWENRAFIYSLCGEIKNADHFQHVTGTMNLMMYLEEEIKGGGGGGWKGDENRLFLPGLKILEDLR